MKKTVTLLTFLFGGSLLTIMLSFWSCQDHDYWFFYKNLDATVSALDTTGNRTPLAERDTCSFQNLRFELHLQYNKLAQQDTRRSGSALYAYKPFQNYKNIDKIKTIKVIALYPYNQFPAGADISGAVNKETLLFQLNGKQMDAPFTDLTVGLPEPSRPVSRQQFAVELRSENNTVLRDTTVLFYLQP